MSDHDFYIKLKAEVQDTVKNSLSTAAGSRYLLQGVPMYQRELEKEFI